MLDEKQPMLWRLMGVSRAFFENVREQAKEECLLHPKQGPVIGLLLDHDGLSQADLVRQMGVSAATVAVSISRLEKLGMIRRVRDEDNRRAYILTLTDKGRQEGRRMQAIMKHTEALTVQDLSQSELDQMNDYCQRMLHNLQGDNKAERKE